MEIIYKFLEFSSNHLGFISMMGLFISLFVAYRQLYLSISHIRATREFLNSLHYVSRKHNINLKELDTYHIDQKTLDEIQNIMKLYAQNECKIKNISKTYLLNDQRSKLKYLFLDSIQHMDYNRGQEFVKMSLPQMETLGEDYISSLIRYPKIAVIGRS
jgi:hypothetical protein